MKDAVKIDKGSVARFRGGLGCLLIDPDPEEQVRESGLVVQTQGPQGAPRWGTVLEPGPGGYVYGTDKWNTARFEKGTRVLYMHIAGYPVELDGRQLRVIRETDVIGWLAPA